MTQDEIIIKLKSLGIIAEIGDEYFLTEKYKEVFSTVKLEPIKPSKLELDYDTLLNGKQGGSNWPVEILESKGRSRYNLFLDACDIPVNCTTSAGSTYRLRSSSKEAINILSNIIEDINICPNTLMQSVRLYYKHMGFPVSFKNYVIDGLILDIYSEHLDGTLTRSLTSGSESKDNQIWQ